jgi:hypothetical protein
MTTACAFEPLPSSDDRSPDATLWAHAELPTEYLQGGAATLPGLARAIASLREEGLFDAFESSSGEETHREQ